MKRILHFKNITFKSSYDWFNIDIHQQLRPLTANYLAMFKVTSIFVLIISKPKVVFGAAGKGAMWDGFCFRRGHTYSTALASKQVEVLEGQQCPAVFVLYIYSNYIVSVSEAKIQITLLILIRGALSSTGYWMHWAGGGTGFPRQEGGGVPGSVRRGTQVSLAPSRASVSLLSCK